MAITLTATWRHITVVIMHTLTRIKPWLNNKRITFFNSSFYFCSSFLFVLLHFVVCSVFGTSAKRNILRLQLCTALHCIQKYFFFCTHPNTENSKTRIFFLLRLWLLKSRHRDCDKLKTLRDYKIIIIIISFFLTSWLRFNILCDYFLYNTMNKIIKTANSVLLTTISHSVHGHFWNELHLFFFKLKQLLDSIWTSNEKKKKQNKSHKWGGGIESLKRLLSFVHLLSFRINFRICNRISYSCASLYHITIVWIPWFKVFGFFFFEILIVHSMKNRWKPKHFMMFIVY